VVSVEAVDLDGGAGEVGEERVVPLVGPEALLRETGEPGAT